MSEWIAKHVGGILLGTSVATVIVAVFTVWLVSQEASIEKKIPVVQRIGSPCRTAFRRGGLEAVRNDSQCTLQTTLIFTNLCDHHPIIPACGLIAGKLSKGVAGQNGNTNSPSQQPGPSGGQRQPHSPESPQEPSSPPRTPVPPLDLNKTICGVTAPLNVPVCN